MLKGILPFVLVATMLAGIDVVLSQNVEPPPGPFSPEVYRERREKVMQEMRGGVALLYSRGGEDRDGYRQDSDFYYLTGVSESGPALPCPPLVSATGMTSRTTGNRVC